MQKKSPILPALSILLALAVGLSGGYFWGKSNQAQPAGPSSDTLEAAYTAATRDAMVAEESEIYPVLAITKDNDLVEWNDDGRVLLLTMHKYPESYVPGETFTAEYGEIWVTSLPEMQKWYDELENKDAVEDWTVRFEALLGMAPAGDHTHFSAFWADPKDLTRPAYNSDVTSDEVRIGFPAEGEGESPDEDYKEWFDGNIIWSYFESEYPWTRLGYTYDYMDGESPYGLSEFLVNADSTVDVEFTYTVDEMVDYLEGNSAK